MKNGAELLDQNKYQAAQPEYHFTTRRDYVSADHRWKSNFREITL